VADFHPGRALADCLKRRFYPLIAENLADAERVLWQHSDDLGKLDLNGVVSGIGLVQGSHVAGDDSK
jgi:hypothetical protein